MKNFSRLACFNSAKDKFSKEFRRFCKNFQGFKILLSSVKNRGRKRSRGPNLRSFRPCPGGLWPRSNRVRVTQDSGHPGGPVTRHFGRLGSQQRPINVDCSDVTNDAVALKKVRIWPQKCSDRRAWPTQRDSPVPTCSTCHCQRFFLLIWILPRSSVTKRGRVILTVIFGSQKNSSDFVYV